MHCSSTVQLGCLHYAQNANINITGPLGKTDILWMLRAVVCPREDFTEGKHVPTFLFEYLCCIDRSKKERKDRTLNCDVAANFAINLKTYYGTPATSVNVQTTNIFGIKMFYLYFDNIMQRMISWTTTHDEVIPIEGL